MISNEMLDGNFSFLEDSEIPSKKNIIEIVKKMISFMKQKFYDDLAANARKIIEIIIDDIFKSNNIESGSDLKTNITILRNQGYSKYGMKIINRFYTIANYGNTGVHEHRSVKHNDALIIINEIYCILKEYADITDYEECDWTKYTSSSDKFESVVSSESKINEQKDDLKIEKRNIRDWLTQKNCSFLIPIYQRGYSWKEENVEQLLIDIEDRVRDNRSHFFGSIAAKQVAKIDNTKEIKIIDGQQRLTTSLLLVSAARDILLERQVKSEEIFPEIFDRQDIGKFFKNPTSESASNNCFIDILKGNLNTNDKNNTNTLVYKNYIYIKEMLKDKDNTEIYHFVSIYLNNFQVSVISFNGKEYTQKTEMTIFENLNSKGKALTLYDMIKNHIFNLCEEEAYKSEEDSKEMTINYNKKIDNIITNQGKENDKKETFFLSLSHYASGDESKKDNIILNFDHVKKAIYKLFDIDKYKDLSTNEYNQFLDKLSIWIKIYKALTKNNGNYEFFDKYLQVSDIISINKDSKKFEIFLPISFLLLEITEWKETNIEKHKFTNSDKKNIRDIYFTILNYIVKTSVISGQGDSDIKRNIYNKTIKIRKLVIDSSDSISKKLEMILDELKMKLENDDRWKYNDFKNNLKLDLNNKVAQTILQYVEHFLMNSYETKEFNEREKPSLEHILPQSPNEWIKEQKQNNPDFIENHFNEEHTKWINRLGNMLILSGPNNSKAKNSVFEEKQNKCYKRLTSPLYKNDDPLIDISNRKNWTFEDIEKRTDALANYIFKEIIKK